VDYGYGPRKIADADGSIVGFAPTPQEAALLEPYRSILPPETFGPMALPPRTDAPNSLRGNLLKELIQKAYAGSGKELVMAALRGHVSAAERAEIQAFLEEDGQ